GFLFGGADNNDLQAGPASATLVTPNLAMTAAGFPQVRAFAGTDHDSAYLGPSDGVDEFVGTPTYAYMTGTTVPFLNLVSGFRTTSASANTAGDFALLFDSAGVDTFSAGPNLARLTNNTTYSLAPDFFSYVRVSSQGGGDTATFFDSGAADLFRSTQSFNFMGAADGSYLDLAIGFTTFNPHGVPPP